MNYQLCTALVAASGDSGAETDFHESCGRIWAFVNATLLQETRLFIIATLREKLIGTIIITILRVTGNRDKIMSQH